MPIYMDRHDVSETVTAENVALLHQADLRIQDQFGCRGLTYWFDEKRKTAFSLYRGVVSKKNDVLLVKVDIVSNNLGWALAFLMVYSHNRPS